MTKLYDPGSLSGSSDSEYDASEGQKASLLTGEKNTRQSQRGCKALCVPFTTLHTFNAMVMHFALGCQTSLIGPCLPYLIARANTTYQDIGAGFTTNGVGAIIGSLVRGYFSTRFHRHRYLFLCLSLGILIASTIWIPWSDSLWLLSLGMFGSGMAGVYLSSDCNALLVESWAEMSAPVTHIYHMVWGVGSLLAPQIARPFLHKYQPILDHHQPSPTSHNTTLDDAKTSALKNLTRLSNVSSITDIDSNTTTCDGLTTAPIQYAFYIVCILPTLMVIILFISYILELCKKKSVVIEYVQLRNLSASDTGSQKRTGLSIFDPGTCAGGKRGYGAILFLLIALYYFNIVGGEACLWRFIFSFAVESDLNFSVQEATVLNSAFGLSFVLGRFLSAVLSICLRPQSILYLACSGLSAGSALFVTYGYKDRIFAWISVITLGLFVAPLFPAGISWANRYLELTPMAVGVPYLACNIGAIAYSYVNGFLFDHFGAVALPWICMVFAMLTTIICMLMHIATFNPNMHLKGDGGSQKTQNDLNTSEKSKSSRLVKNH